MRGSIRRLPRRADRNCVPARMRVRVPAGLHYCLYKDLGISRGDSGIIDSGELLLTCCDSRGLLDRQAKMTGSLEPVTSFFERTPERPIDIAGR